jgi:GNAT superfamily N-acetyltransferase
VENIQFQQFNPESHGILVEELTDLLHKAYAGLANQGLRYVASHQSSTVTLQRLSEGESYLAFLQNKLIGTITLTGLKPKSSSNWYRTEGVYSFHQFGISPEFQGRGIGSQIMDLIEIRARDLGATELALDTSENATHLISLYQKRGYRFIEFVQWEGVNYRSVIMSKSLSVQ